MFQLALGLMLCAALCPLIPGMNFREIRAGRHAALRVARREWWHSDPGEHVLHAMVPECCTAPLQAACRTRL